MEQQIEEEMNGRPADQVLELNLDSCKASKITGLTDQFTNLETLSITNNELASLSGFPALPNLRKLDLSDNKLSGDLEPLAQCPLLEYVCLSGNPITDLSVLEPLKKLKSLASLDLINCEVSETDGYREKVFAMLPTLLYVDGIDSDGQHQPDEDEELSDDDEPDDLGDDGDEEEPEQEAEDEEGEDEHDVEEAESPKGKKRKHEDEENPDDA